MALAIWNVYTCCIRSAVGTMPTLIALSAEMPHLFCKNSLLVRAPIDLSECITLSLTQFADLSVCIGFRMPGRRLLRLFWRRQNPQLQFRVQRAISTPFASQLVGRMASFISGTCRQLEASRMWMHSMLPPLQTTQTWRDTRSEEPTRFWGSDGRWPTASG